MNIETRHVLYAILFVSLIFGVFSNAGVQYMTEKTERQSNTNVVADNSSGQIEVDSPDTALAGTELKGKIKNNGQKREFLIKSTTGFEYVDTNKRYLGPGESTELILSPSGEVAGERLTYTVIADSGPSKVIREESIRVKRDKKVVEEYNEWVQNQRDADILVRKSDSSYITLYDKPQDEQSLVRDYRFNDGSDSYIRDYSDPQKNIGQPIAQSQGIFGTKAAKIRQGESLEFSVDSQVAESGFTLSFWTKTENRKEILNINNKNKGIEVFSSDSGIVIATKERKKKISTPANSWQKVTVKHDGENRFSIASGKESATLKSKKEPKKYSVQFLSKNCNDSRGEKSKNNKKKGKNKNNKEKGHNSGNKECRDSSQQPSLFDNIRLYSSAGVTPNDYPISSYQSANVSVNYGTETLPTLSLSSRSVGATDIRVQLYGITNSENVKKIYSKKITSDEQVISENHTAYKKYVVEVQLRTDDYTQAPTVSRIAIEPSRFTHKLKQYNSDIYPHKYSKVATVKNTANSSRFLLINSSNNVTTKYDSRTILPQEEYPIHVQSDTASNGTENLRLKIIQAQTGKVELQQDINLDRKNFSLYYTQEISNFNVKQEEHRLENPVVSKYTFRYGNTDVLYDEGYRKQHIAAESISRQKTGGTYGLNPNKSQNIPIPLRSGENTRAVLSIDSFGWSDGALAVLEGSGTEYVIQLEQAESLCSSCVRVSVQNETLNKTLGTFASSRDPTLLVNRTSTVLLHSGEDEYSQTRIDGIDSFLLYPNQSVQDIGFNDTAGVSVKSIRQVGRGNESLQVNTLSQNITLNQPEEVSSVSVSRRKERSLPSGKFRLIGSPSSENREIILNLSLTNAFSKQELDNVESHSNYRVEFIVQSKEQVFSIKKLKIIY